MMSTTIRTLGKEEKIAREKTEMLKILKHFINYEFEHRVLFIACKILVFK